ncbi:MAG: gas vesicle protein [Nannocystaceae bacterium]
MANRALIHGTRSSTLADVLERVLDKGVVIAGDIRIKLVEIELLTIQLRLVVCSVERAIEMGIDWWRHDSHLSPEAPRRPLQGDRAPAPAPAPASQEQVGPPAEARIAALEQELALLRSALGLDAETPLDP